MKYIVALLSVAALLSACNPNQQGSSGPNVNKSDVGTILGGALGAVAGSNVGKGKGNIAAIAAGTLLGAYLGREVGASLDRADMAYYQRTSQNALETNKTGTTSRWVNPDSGNSGTITPTHTYTTSNDVHCREYTQTINVGGKMVEGFGEACRQPDGSWKIVN